MKPPARERLPLRRRARYGRPAGPRRGSLIARGLVYLGVMAGLIGVLCAQFAGAFEDYVKVKAFLTSSGDALVEGSDVKLRGVVVGRVGRIERGKGPNDLTGVLADEGLTSVLGTRGAEVDLQLFPRAAELVPAAVTARSLPANFFGQAFVDLLPRVTAPDATVEPIQDGAEVPQDLSLETQQLQDVFDKLYRVLTAVQPAKLQSALGALAEALSGRGKQVNGLIARSDAYLRGLKPGLDDLDHDLSAFARFAETLEQQSPRLLDSVDDLLVTARTIVERQGQLIALLGAGLDLTKNATDVVSDNERRAILVTRQGRQIFSTFADHPAAFSDAFVDLGRFLGGLSTRETGRIGLDTLLSTAPLRPYTAFDCPRYPGLDGPNCRTAGRSTGGAPPRPAARPADLGPVYGGQIYGGTIGPVGSVTEKLSLAALLAMLGRQAGADDGTASYGDVGILLAGSVLRGTTVVVP
jgi:phospholipid/cholesterol/gamma-HCH transport system substrate-binding protein